MKNENGEPNQNGDLRRQAEECLKEGRSSPAGSKEEGKDALALVHELQVHQIELEMQNEEIQHARDEMEAGLEKYSDLYEFAPVGFLTLDREGTIHEANLTSARLLGIARSGLVKRRLAFCVSAPDLPVFNAFLQRVFNSKARQF
jgi:PAS domain-containing protein